jgi:hypothetical protein
MRHTSSITALTRVPRPLEPGAFVDKLPFGPSREAGKRCERS